MGFATLVYISPYQKGQKIYLNQISMLHNIKCLVASRASQTPYLLFSQKVLDHPMVTTVLVLYKNMQAFCVLNLVRLLLSTYFLFPH